MEISKEFIQKLGWSLYPNYYDLPKDFYHKEPYPFTLWWDESYKAFFVVYKDELNNKDCVFHKKKFIPSCSTLGEG